MVKKQFIDKKTAQHFSIVHRSQKDPLIADTEAPSRVLVPTLASANLKNKKKSLLDRRVTFKEDIESKVGSEVANDDEIIDLAAAAAQYGLDFGLDGYDYSKHMKPIGQSSDAVFIEAASKAKPTKTVSFQLPSEALASETQLPVGLMNQQAIPDMYNQLGLPQNVMDAMEALEDQAFVEDDIDQFFDQLNQSGDEDYDPELDVNEEEEYLDEDDWQAQFRKFKKEQREFDSDEEYDDFDASSNYPKSRIARTTASKFSMTSSAMFRNKGLSLLDDQFDEIEADYLKGSEDEDLDEDVPELVELREDFDKILDDFLDNFEVVGKRAVPKMEGKDGLEKLDLVRTELNSNQNVIDNVMEKELELVESEEEVEKELNWDCQTILTTYSNLNNHPKVINLSTLPKITTSRSKQNTSQLPILTKPIVVNTNDASDEDDSEHSDEDKPKINKGKGRSKQETKEEKKLRKEQIKLEKQNRKSEKKQTKLQFKDLSNKKKPNSNYRVVPLE